MRAAKSKVMRSRTVASGSPVEAAGRASTPAGVRAVEHQKVVPSSGQGPQGTAAAMVPFGAAPACPAPAVGAGKGFKGW